MAECVETPVASPLSLVILPKTSGGQHKALVREGCDSVHSSAQQNINVTWE